MLVVNKEDYEKCNTKNPIGSFSDGFSVFKLDRSGPFLFISGIQEKCEKGEKLIVVVLAVRGSHGSPISPSPASGEPPAQTPISVPSGSPGEGSAPAPSPRSSSASGSPPLFSFTTSSGFSLGVVMALVFGCFVGPF